MGSTPEKLKRRADELHEFNPMLGFRGVRLAIAFPEIAEMQARAIFEGAVEAQKKTGAPVTAEIMVPLVFAKRELDLVKARIDAMAEAVTAETGVAIALSGRHDDRTAARRLARRRDRRDGGILLLRHQRPDPDDARHLARRRRLISWRLCRQGHSAARSLRFDRSGRRRRIGGAGGRARHARRAKNSSSAFAANMAAIRPPSLSARRLGLDYVSCSPYRVPIARLAAAQAALGKAAGSTGVSSGATLAARRDFKGFAFAAGSTPADDQNPRAGILRVLARRPRLFACERACHGPTHGFLPPHLGFAADSGKRRPVGARRSASLLRSDRAGRRGSICASHGRPRRHAVASARRHDPNQRKYSFRGRRIAARNLAGDFSVRAPPGAASARSDFARYGRVSRRLPEPRSPARPARINEGHLRAPFPDLSSIAAGGKRGLSRALAMIETQKAQPNWPPCSTPPSSRPAPMPPG